MNTCFIIGFTVFCSTFWTNFVNGQICNAGSDYGENNPQDENTQVDAGTGITILIDAEDNEFTFKCCGLLTGWDYYTRTNTGTVYFQVWRKGGGTWNLVGQNQHTVTTTNALQAYTVPVAERIFVQNGDVIGIHYPGLSMITYGTSSWRSYYRITSSYTTGQTSFDFDSQPRFNQRDYGIHGNTEPTNAPVITLPGAPLSFPDSTTLGTVLHTLVVTDVDVGDTVTTSLISNTNPANLEFDAATMEVKTLSSSLTVGTHKLTFRASDICGQTSTGTLTISIYNVPPTINNLPASVDLIETQSAELTLYVIETTDPSDSVTCSITSPASSPFATKLSPGTSNTAIYVKANQAMNYLTQRQYDLTIECTDGKDPVTGTFTVFVLKNAQPAFTNMQNRTEVTSSATAGVTVFTVEATDPESDTLSYRLTCSTGTCPFTIDSTAKVTTTSSLSPYTIPAYDLFIYVSDGLTEVGPKTVTVVVNDINTAPVITNLPLPTSIYVHENSALGLLLYTVKNLDVNSADTVTFSMSTSPTEALTYFDVNTASGDIRTSSSTLLNFEDLSASIGTSFTLSMYVSDGSESVVENLAVNVVDINEAPYFQKNVYGINGNEETIGNTLSDPSFTVTDPEGDTLTYKMDCGQYSAYFSIDASTAAITVTKAYDRDTTSNPSLITCSVTATDSEFTATATVEITINDVNDHSPEFAQLHYTFYVTPTTSVNTLLGTVEATDADAGIYGTLYYDLDQTSLSNEFFGLTSTSLYVKNSLEQFSVGQIFTIIAKVTDGGGLQATATIYIVIPDTTTSTIVTTTTERYYTFFEDSRNTAWFTALFMIMIISGCILSYLLYKFCNCRNIYRTEDQKLHKKGNTKDRYTRHQKQVSDIEEPGEIFLNGA